MFQDKKNFSFERGFLLLVVIINVLIIRGAYTVTSDLYWVLLLSIPMLFFAIYFERRISKKEKYDGRIESGETANHQKDNSISSRGINSEELKVSFGNKYCDQPYLSSIICFEAISADQNIKFMPREIVLSGDNEYTDEMMESLNDSLFSDDCTWRISPGYAGCRRPDFSFDPEAFRAKAVQPNVKMIELELPGLNNKATMPARNISYAKQTNNAMHSDLHREHTAFCNADSMVIFLDSLRQLSGKKPVGINIRITDKKEFHEMCYAFCKTHIVPDFIVVENCEKENIFLNNIPITKGMPLFEALQFVSKTLEMYGLSKETKIIAAAEIYKGIDVLKLRALGADAISMRNSFIRGDKPYQNEGINSTAFAMQVMQRLRNDILNSTMNLIKSWGYIHIKDITLSSFFRSVESFDESEGNREQEKAGRNINEKRNYRLPHKAFLKRTPVQKFFLIKAGYPRIRYS
ncbi:MAG: glutamate synthase-related protein [Ginsengibacter sp.]